MKINVTYNKDPRTIEEFAIKYSLVMEVRERPLGLQHNGRFIAHFNRAEIKEGGCLVGTYGTGDTVDDAIRDYSRQIQTKLMVIGAYTDKRVEVIVPVFEDVVDMKPRIESLIEEAGFPTFTTSITLTSYAPLQRLVELAIKECHEVIVVGGVDDLDGVMKHFEIE